MSSILYECFDFLVWKWFVKRSRILFHSILYCVSNFEILADIQVHVVDSWFTSCGTSLVHLPNCRTNYSAFAPDITKARSSAVNVTRLMERKPLIDTWSTKGKRVDKLEKGHLEFRDVHFRYPTRYAP